VFSAASNGTLFVKGEQASTAERCRAPECCYSHQHQPPSTVRVRSEAVSAQQSGVAVRVATRNGMVAGARHARPGLSFDGGTQEKGPVFVLRSHGVGTNTHYLRYSAGASPAALAFPSSSPPVLPSLLFCQSCCPSLSNTATLTDRRLSTAERREERL
jgi:hypothetical protein